jgi:hypothetical protein
VAQEELQELQKGIQELQRDHPDWRWKKVGLSPFTCEPTRVRESLLCLP